jgi:signal transduction histidine kinase
VFIQEKGFLYNFFPFGMIFFALFVLILVNEPIRKITSQQRINQNKIQEASTKLSRVQIFEEATEIAKETLTIISPYEYLAIYIYHQSGNIFLLSDHETRNNIEFPTKFEFDRTEVQKFINMDSPIEIKDSPFNQEIFQGSLVFQLVRKKQLLGSVIIKLIENDTITKNQSIELTKYLLLQLAIALDNLRILNELGDHEKISAIGTFSSGIIHDLKNPIDGLRMIIELLREEIDDADSRMEYVNELYDGIVTLKSKLLHSFDFVNYNKTQNAKVGINELLTGIIHHHENSSYQIFKLFLSSEEIYIYGDSEQLKFVFENIIQNAIEASDLKTPIIIKTQFKSENNCQIDIIDSGEGISDEIMGKLFDMFFSTKGKSRGLGLTLANRIVNSHNGVINVSREDIQGTKFSVILPIIKEG